MHLHGSIVLFISQRHWRKNFSREGGGNDKTQTLGVPIWFFDSWVGWCKITIKLVSILLIKSHTWLSSRLPTKIGKTSFNSLYYCCFDQNSPNYELFLCNSNFREYSLKSSQLTTFTHKPKSRPKYYFHCSYFEVKMKCLPSKNYSTVGLTSRCLLNLSFMNYGLMILTFCKL